MPKIQEKRQHNNTIYFVVIPKSIIRLKGWKKGDELVFSVDPKTQQIVLLRV